MGAPKVDTIRRYCDNHLAIEILTERGLLSERAARALHRRARAVDDAAYADIYGWVVPEDCDLCGPWRKPTCFLECACACHDREVDRSRKARSEVPR